MKRQVIARKRFLLEKFLDAIEGFVRSQGSYDGPTPVVHDDIAYFDDTELALALDGDSEDDEDDEDEGERADIPQDGVGRLEAGLTLFGHFALFDGHCGFNCADGEEIEVPDLDEEDEDEDEDEDEPTEPRRRRTKKYVEMVENTPCDENRGYGYLIGLSGKTVTIESALINDMSGDCEVEPVAEPNLLDEPMTRFVKSFVAKASPRKK